jgi:hypothetical protein
MKTRVAKPDGLYVKRFILIIDLRNRHRTEPFATKYTSL